MFLRRLLLVLGTVALIAGVTLATLWLMRAPDTRVAEREQVPQQTVLTAARPLPAGTLLRAGDLAWRQMPADSVPEGAYAQGQIAESELFGAVVRRDIGVGEPVIVGRVVKPTESGFLAAVLNPGMRAVSIDIDAASGNAGLVAPGDRVDILLTQTLGERGGNDETRTVGETVLRDLRVVAVGQAISAAERPAPAQSALGGGSEAKLPKTVTLEVEELQAQALLVAVQLGKVQLALRSLEEGERFARPRPTWAADVSSALRAAAPAAPEPAETAEDGTAESRAPRVVPVTAIEIIHGTQIERRCFGEDGRARDDCAPAPAVN